MTDSCQKTEAVARATDILAEAVARATEKKVRSISAV
jgi:hypothetical protein